MKSNSARHHYIPKFLIKGFTNSEGLLYIYDKKEDKIKDKLRSPKSVFWEENRNSVTIKENESSSLIEDEFFKALDNQSSIFVKKFQEDQIDRTLLSDENLGQFHFFLINLFWRVPLTDFASTDLIQRAEIKAQGIDPEILRNDKEFHKMKRIGLYQHTIDQFGEYPPPASNYHVLLSEFEDDLFVLGDNPIVFERTPKEFIDLRNLDHMIPVSSTRVYIHTIKGFEKMTRKLGFFLNAKIIDQSKNYVVSGNFELLQKSVELYREFKNKHLLFNIEQSLFERA